MANSVNCMIAVRSLSCGHSGVHAWIDMVRWTCESAFTDDGHYNSSWTGGYRDCVRDLGVLLDSSMNMCQHVATVSSTCFFHLRRLCRILDIDARKRFVCALIGPLTRIDYCNSALAGLPDSTLAPLQLEYTARRRTIRHRLTATGSRHSCTADAPLAAGPSAYYARVLRLNVHMMLHSDMRQL